MQIRSIDPWGWEEFGIVPANEVTGATRTVYFSGFPAQARPQDALQVPGDTRGQLAASLDNVEAALTAADMTWANVVRLNLYTTDIDGVMAAYGVLAERLSSRGAKVTGCLLGVARLAMPELTVEIEATAVA